ncbi:MAG TPA: tetratricopeptide repeat protein [Thermoanaerobaculia bacterium]|nr:tetratricopeptide repeat protein [Thermoanaerobaculia bacterium]
MILTITFLLATAFGAPSASVEAVSLLGRPLLRPQYPEEITAQREQDLADARAALERNPKSADALLWVGRRLAYLGRFREAIDTFSEGVRRFPKDARFLRHRGHRYITVRESGRALADLDRAEELVRGKPDQVEPDGLPNARNIPVSTLQSNTCYHLGLAWYLKGEFERALPVYQRCARTATNADQLVSVSHWLYMTLRRLGRPRDADAVLTRTDPSLEVIENIAYHKLLMMYRGEIALEELLGESMEGLDRATILYGIGNWYVYNGEPAKGREIFERVAAEEPWPAFGTIAAEAELARELK